MSVHPVIEPRNGESLTNAGSEVKRVNLTLQRDPDKSTLAHRTGLREDAAETLSASKQRRLDDLCGLTRNLFWAFEEVEFYTTGLESCQRDHTSWRRTASRVVQHELFQGFFLFLTFYALFGPDMAALFGHSAHNEESRGLTIVNTVVLFLFVLEAAISCWVFDGYLCSGRFWVDAFATVSIIGDTWIGGEIVQSDAAVAGRGTRLTRLVRIGGRSGRVVRMLRITRAMQVLRLIPKLQSWMERSTQDLALLLWHKRIWHIFQFLDTAGEGRLSEEDLDFFCEAFERQFPNDGKDSRQSVTVVGTVWNAAVSRGKSARKSLQMPRGTIMCETAAGQTVLCDGTYPSLAENYFKVVPAARRSFGRCLDDIHCMKESCAIVERAIGGLTLKVCVLLLSMLIGGELLAASSDDFSEMEGLQVMTAAGGNAEIYGLTGPRRPNLVCEVLKDYYSQLPDSGDLLLAIVGRRQYWEEGCYCCDPLEDTNALLPTAMDAIAKDVLEAADKEPHELAVWAVCADGVEHRLVTCSFAHNDNTYCDNCEVIVEDDPSRYTYWSLAIFDIHEVARGRAGRDLLFTATIVVLLLGMVMYFASDMKKLSNATVLHPLWELMDDMCALKSIDVLSERVHSEEIQQYLPSTFVCKCLGKKYNCMVKFETASELKQLRGAFEKLRVSMLSWSKYVPVSLLKQLFAARIEANIGCTRYDVSIFFCDIHDFKELCKDMQPVAVLHLLSGVFDKIYAALENNGGTFLEFIGDEVLAVFNAPIEVAEHNRCAVTAAVMMRDAIERTPSLSNVKLQCSVHRANVLAGNLGSSTRMKYGILGDGVNLCARLKSLNTRYGTHMLVSGDALDFPSADKEFLTRPIGNLVLKGRTTPTKVYELLANRDTASERLTRGAEKHQQGFEAFVLGNFIDARKYFDDAYMLLSPPPVAGANRGDQPAEHLRRLCDHYIKVGTPSGWDGSEHLTKKAW